MESIDSHPQKALVTGASGFVGKHLVEHLLQSNDKVVATGTDTETPFNNKLVNYVAVNLLDEANVDEAIDFTDIDIIYHLAGLAATGPSFAEPRKYMETNTGIELSLFEVCRRQNAKPRFLIISSGSVYDGQAKPPFTEKTEVQPTSPYAASKLMQETLGLYYYSQGFEVVIARPFNHIGPGQQPGFLVPDLAQQIVKIQKSGPASLKAGNLDAKRDYTDVRDIVKAYRLLATHGLPGEIYNVCSGRSVAGKEILRQLLELSEAAIKVAVDTKRLRPSDANDIYGDPSKINLATGWEAQIPLRQTLQDTLEYWRAAAN